MKKDWKASLREELLTSETTFRHDLSFVPVSSIAGQYYCEVKVDHEYVRGEIPTEEKEVGTELHEEILAMKRVRTDELIEHIEKAPRVTASFLLHGDVEKLRIVGIPDAVIFEKGAPRWLIELKTTRGDTSKLWRDQALQVRLYGTLLETMGFDCSNLELVLARMKQDDPLEPDEKRKLLAEVIESLARHKTNEVEARYGMKVFVFPYASAEAKDAVMWAQGYWLGNRKPIPTKNESKCRACEYRDWCPYSLYKPVKS